MRRKLDKTRPGITHHFSITTEKGERDGYITTNFFDDGTPGEVFLSVNKQGSLISLMMNCISILTSIALQYGVPLKLICEKMMYQSGGLGGYTSEFKFVKSYIDYIFRYLHNRFLTEEGKKKIEAIGNKMKYNSAIREAEKQFGPIESVVPVFIAEEKVTNGEAHE